MGTLNLYENDFYAWTQEQAKLLKDKALDKLDINNLFEEIESMGKHEKRELSSRLEVLLMHLLKWKYQPARQCKSWQRTIKIQRIDLIKHLKSNPSLNAIVNEYIQDAYETAVLKAAEETNLDEENFPEHCEWTSEQILNNSFLPS